MNQAYEFSQRAPGNRRIAAAQKSKLSKFLDGIIPATVLAALGSLSFTTCAVAQDQNNAKPSASNAPATQPAGPQAPAATGPATGATAGAPGQPATPPGGQPPAPPSFASSGPFSFSAALTADLISNVAGGVSRGAKVLTKTSVSAAYDGAADDRPGWSAQASLQYTKGGHISAANVGDVQGLDNIEAFNALRLYELWIAKQWLDGKAAIKFGFTDLNVDFDTQQVAALFINSSNGVGPEFSHSGLNGPSIFPTTTLALSGFFKPTEALTLRAGVFNGLAGSPDHPGVFALKISPREGALVVGQAEYAGPRGLRTEVGAWAYTAKFDALHLNDPLGDPFRTARMRGAYALVEGQIISAASGGHTVSGWVRAGIGDPVVQRITGYVGAGLVGTGLLKGRDEDQAGISIAHAIVDEPNLAPDAPPAKRAETAFELTYRVQARDWLSIQPDLQYVVHPNGDRVIPNALVIGLRLNVNLTKNLIRAVKGEVP